MGTVVAFESQAGVAIAGDTQAVEGGTVTGQHVQRVFDADAVGVGVVGDTSDIQAFQRHLEKELRTRRLEHDGVVRIDELSRIAARQAEKTNVAAVVAAHDADGIVRLREVGPEGQIFESETVALGEGAELAAGQLETIDPTLDIDETATAVADIIEIVAERDTTTGGGVDVWSLANAPGTDHSDEV